VSLSAAAAVMPPAVPWRRLVVLGDGLARSSPGRSAQRGWPAALAAALAHRRGGDLAFRNLARRGACCAQIRVRQLQPALDFAPDLVVLAYGLDDPLRPAFDLDVAEGEIARLLTGLRQADADLVVVSPFDAVAGPFDAVAGPFDAVAGSLDAAGSDPVPRTLPVRQRRRAHAVSEHVASLARRHGALHIDLRSRPAVSDIGAEVLAGLTRRRRSRAAG
jgi:hypothetical protein